MNEVDLGRWQPVNKQHNINIYNENILQARNTDKLTEQCKGHVISTEHFDSNVRQHLKHDYISDHCCGEGAMCNNYCTCDVVEYEYANAYNHYNVNIDNYNQLLGKTNTKDVDNWSVDRMLARLYDLDGNQTHLIWYSMSDDHTNLSDCPLAEVKL